MTSNPAPIIVISGGNHKIIQQIHDYFAETDVRRVSLFGSLARDAFTPASDVDLLMEVDAPIG